MTVSYASITEVKAVMPDTPFGVTYDAILTSLVERASRSVDRLLNREPGAFAVTSDTIRYFDGSGSSQLWIGELAIAPTTVEVAESGDFGSYTIWSSSDFYLWPYNAVAQGIPFLRIDIDRLYGSKVYWPAYPKGIKITGHFGYSTDAPTDVKQATIIQTVRWFKRGQQAFRDVGAIMELGQLTYAQAIDPDIGLIVEHMRVPTI